MSEIQPRSQGGAPELRPDAVIPGPLTGRGSVKIEWAGRQEYFEERLAPLILPLWQLDIIVKRAFQRDDTGVVYVEFLGAEDAKRFLDLVGQKPAERDDDSEQKPFEDLYWRINSWGRPPEKCWDYAATPINWCDEHTMVGPMDLFHDFTSPSDYDFRMLISFPATDLPVLISRAAEAARAADGPPALASRVARLMRLVSHGAFRLPPGPGAAFAAFGSVRMVWMEAPDRAVAAAIHRELAWVRAQLHGLQLVEMRHGVLLRDGVAGWLLVARPKRILSRAQHPRARLAAEARRMSDIEERLATLAWAARREAYKRADRGDRESTEP